MDDHIQGLRFVAEVVHDTFDAQDEEARDQIDSMAGDLHDQYNRLFDVCPNYFRTLANELEAEILGTDIFHAFANASFEEINDFETEDLVELKGQLMLISGILYDLDDTEAAEYFVFIGFKIEHVLKDYDSNTLGILAECLYANIDWTPYVRSIRKGDICIDPDVAVIKDSMDLKQLPFLGELIKKRTGVKISPLELSDTDRLQAATEVSTLMTLLDDEDPKAYELLANCHLGYARVLQNHLLTIGTYLDELSDGEVALIKHHFEAALLNARRAIAVDEDPNYDTYAPINYSFAEFLLDAGKEKEAFQLYQSLINENVNPIETRVEIVRAVMLGVLHWTKKRNTPEGIRYYFGMRNIVLKYSQEVIRKVKELGDDAEPNDKYNLALIYSHLTNLYHFEGSNDDVLRTLDALNSIDHPFAKEMVKQLGDEITAVNEKTSGNSGSN